MLICFAFCRGKGFVMLKDAWATGLQLILPVVDRTLLVSFLPFAVFWPKEDDKMTPSKGNHRP